MVVVVTAGVTLHPRVICVLELQAVVVELEPGAAGPTEQVTAVFVAVMDSVQDSSDDDVSDPVGEVVDSVTVGFVGSGVGPGGVGLFGSGPGPRSIGGRASFGKMMLKPSS